jgi:hypothetical protein
MNNIKILLSLVCSSVLCYGSDTFYAKVNDEGKLVEILRDIHLPMPKNDREKIYESSFLRIANGFIKISKDNYSYETDRYTLDRHYFGCGKGVIFDVAKYIGENNICKNPFFSLSSPIVTERYYDGDVSIAGTVVINTILVPVAGVMGTVLYEKKFDPEKYNALIDTYGLEKNKKALFLDLDHTNTRRFVLCDLSVYDAKDYTSITPDTACKRESNEGLFFYSSNKRFMFDAPGTPIGLFGADEVNNPLKVSQKILLRMIEQYMDVVALYPEIPLPKTLPQLVLEKSQFEKESDFQKRKMKALSERDEEQKKLNGEYIQAVKKRNLAIFEELVDRKKSLKEKIIEFRKQAFMAVATPPTFTFENYDAELEKLYGQLSFGEDSYRVVGTNIDPKLAEQISNKSISIVPQANYEMIQSGESATFETKELLLMVGSEKIKLDYTDNRYVAPSMTLVIPSYNISAFQAGIADATKESATINATALKALQDLERYRIKSQMSISDTAIHRVNAKAPSWYEKMECGDEKCSVGRGETQQEALKVALAQLGCIVKSSINSELLVEKTVTNDIEQKKSTYTIKESCSNTFDEGSLNVSNTAEMDGWYYVRAVMNGDK